jgi:hypothetical protein
MTRISWSWCLCVLLDTLCVVGPVRAQQSTTLVPAVATAASLAPTLSAVRFGVTDLADPPTTPNSAAGAIMQPHEGRVVAILGGAAVIAGLLIGGTGGTIIAISGAALGIYGLYIWER